MHIKKTIIRSDGTRREEVVPVRIPGGEKSNKAPRIIRLRPGGKVRKGNVFSPNVLVQKKRKARSDKGSVSESSSDSSQEDGQRRQSPKEKRRRESSNSSSTTGSSTSTISPSSSDVSATVLKRLLRLYFYRKRRKMSKSRSRAEQRPQIAE